jgi:predicted secreted hydrolase
MRQLAAFLLLVAIGMAWWLLGRQPAEAPEPSELGEILGGTATEGFARAMEPREFRFPEDHGPHFDFRNEWWYFTGNLEERASKNRYGFQLVFFRNALAPGRAEGDSPWRTHQSWMAHFALTDAESGQFHPFERFSRGTMELAGAKSKPFSVWLDDWSVSETNKGWRLQASEEEVSINLELVPQGPPILQGDRGLSHKSGEPGNASYYYSIPRLAAEGDIELDGRQHPVNGLVWLDREWSTSALGEDQAGWDWFSLQLSDGTDLMFYRLRKKDGSADPYSAGSLLRRDGTQIALAADDVQLEELDHWQSPKGGRYPISWRLRIPGQAIELEVRPVLESQELDLYVRYWEGAVDVSGSRAGQPLKGRGYLEMTGYAE